MSKIEGNWVVYSPEEIKQLAAQFDMSENELFYELTKKKVRLDIQEAIDKLLEEKSETSEDGK